MNEEAALAEFRRLDEEIRCLKVEKEGAEERCRILLEAKNHWMYRALEAEANLKAADSALSQAEAAARAYQDDLRDARAEARFR